MSILKKIAVILAFSFAANCLIIKLESQEFLKFLYSNIIVILITLLAINTATISVIVAKLNEIGKAKGLSFDKTVKEIKTSLLEQIILIALTAFILILYYSPKIRSMFSYHDSLFNTLIISIFMYSIEILRDTGCAIFEINDIDEK